LGEAVALRTPDNDYVCADCRDRARTGGEVKIKGISPIADHWRTKAEELQRDLALKGLQAEAMREAIGRAVGKMKDYLREEGNLRKVPALSIIADLEGVLKEKEGKT
jgi:hypothetical protein